MRRALGPRAPASAAGFLLLTRVAARSGPERIAELFIYEKEQISQSIAVRSLLPSNISEVVRAPHLRACALCAPSCCTAAPPPPNLSPRSAQWATRSPTAAASATAVASSSGASV